MDMDTKTQAVSDALARAHHAAKTGSSQAKSGMIDDRSAYVRSVLIKAQSATRSWANWEAINAHFAPGADAAAALGWLNLPAIGDVRMALARDAILTAFSLSDPIQSDRLTLCQLSNWLDTDRQNLASKEWARDLGYDPKMVADAAQKNARRIERFRSLVSPEWTMETATNNAFASMRMSLKPTRNHLAHALQTEITLAPTVDEIRQFLALTLDLATDASLIWLGSADGSDKFRNHSKLVAEKFWQHAFAEPISLWQSDIRDREIAGINTHT